MKSFPLELIGEPLEGAAHSRPSANIETPFESGKTKVRGKYTVRNYTTTLQWQLDRVTFSIFKLFFEVELNEGRDWFLMDIPTRGGNEPHECRFFSNPFDQDDFGFKNWIFTVQLETRPVETEADLYIALALSYNSMPNPIADAIDGLREYLDQYEEQEA